MYEWYTWFRYLSSTGDMLVRGVGGVCDMCMCQRQMHHAFQAEASCITSSNRILLDGIPFQLRRVQERSGNNE